MIGSAKIVFKDNNSPEDIGRGSKASCIKIEVPGWKTHFPDDGSRYVEYMWLCHLEQDHSSIAYEGVIFCHTFPSTWPENSMWLVWSIFKGVTDFLPGRRLFRGLVKLFLDEIFFSGWCCSSYFKKSPWGEYFQLLDVPYKFQLAN